MKKKNAYQKQYQLVLLGDSAVGKTSILFRFTNDEFYANYVHTIG